jgi:hypothetical protein
LHIARVLQTYVTAKAEEVVDEGVSHPSEQF